MSNQHSISDLRSMLKSVRDVIQALEADPRGPHTGKLSKRIDEAKMQEMVILAKLAERGVAL
jgi:hypothetical protein